MQIDTFDEVMAAGAGMFPLLAIPLVALLAAVALSVGLFLRKPLVIGLAVTLVLVGLSATMSVRDTVSSPSSVDSLMMLLPLSLVIGAVPFLARMTPVAFRAVRRRLPAREQPVVAAHAD